MTAPGTPKTTVAEIDHKISRVIAERLGLSEFNSRSHHRRGRFQTSR
jgi:DNA-binding CsgD family transcriptional regulator